ncbi:hypothetical protein E4T39_02029 [Aureobasidium subglaciale]|nr:hypothetical protein E4T39_02029 [Aureobasidium subglaciale]
MAANSCDHREDNLQGHFCTADPGFEPGFMVCDDEPKDNHLNNPVHHDDDYTVCLDCWQNIQDDQPQGFGLRREMLDTFGQLIYQHNPATGTWDLRNNVPINEQNRLETTQSLLCEPCVREEIAHFRRCEADDAYATTALGGNTEHVEDRLTNSCVCRKRFITRPHYCLTCMRDALDSRKITADQNKDWLNTLSISASGERRHADPAWTNTRVQNNYAIPCRCGRDIGRVLVAPAPKATFCLACNGTKIWRQHIPDERYPTRWTRARVANPADKYPLEMLTSDQYNPNVHIRGRPVTQGHF